MLFGYCAFTFAMGGFAYWAPKYLHVQYGMETGGAGQAFGGLTVVGGAIGTLLGMARGSADRSGFEVSAKARPTTPR